MSDAKRCDRCGQFYEEYPEHTAMDLLDTDEKKKDLCKDCDSSLFDWWLNPQRKQHKKKKQSHNWSEESKQAARDRMQKKNAEIHRVMEENKCSWKDAKKILKLKRSEGGTAKPKEKPYHRNKALDHVDDDDVEAFFNEDSG